MNLNKRCGSRLASGNESGRGASEKQNQYDEYKQPSKLQFGKRLMGGKTYRAIFLGGKRTIECALQNQFWRPQKVGFAWSVPVPSKENNRAKTNGGKTYHRAGGSKTVFGKGFYGMFSPPLSFPPPFCFSLNNPSEPLQVSCRNCKRKTKESP